MNVRQIIEQVFMAGKSITMEFSTQKELDSFRSTLAVYITRYNKMLKALGEKDIFSGKVLIGERISSPKTLPIIIQFKLGNTAFKSIPYKILSIDEYPYECKKENPASN